ACAEESMAIRSLAVASMLVALLVLTGCPKENGNAAKGSSGTKSGNSAKGGSAEPTDCETVAKTFGGLLLKNDLAGAYAMTTAAYQKRVSLGEFTKMHEKIVEETNSGQ